MLAFWSHEGVVFLLSPHLITSSRLPCLGSTDTHWPHLGGPVPSPPKWWPFPQGPRTLPYRGPEHWVSSLLCLTFYVRNRLWSNSCDQTIQESLSEIFNINLQFVARRKSVIDVFGSTNQEQDFLGCCMPRVLSLNLQCSIITFGLMVQIVCIWLLFHYCFIGTAYIFVFPKSRAGHIFHCPLISLLSVAPLIKGGAVIFYFENIILMEERLFLNLWKASVPKIMFCRLFKDVTLSTLLFFVSCSLKWSMHVSVSLSVSVCVRFLGRLCPCPS